MKKKVAVLVPAHNEDRVISKTLASIIKLVPKEDVYVVDDGSTDNTFNVAKIHTDNVLTISNNGKANAINTGVNQFNLIENYEYILPMDADTHLGTKYLKETIPLLDADIKKEYVCVIGRVISRKHNWLTAYRLWEYEIAQSIHKAAQAVENAITICPGCATIYRSEIFRTLSVPSGTLTEDMDFTFLIHRKRLGKIAYASRAFVITQDPQTISGYIKQITRWYTGFWQCVIKHNVPWGGQMIDFEVGGLALEGLFNGLLVILFIVLSPIALMKNPILFSMPILVDFALFLLPSIIMIGFKYRLLRILKYVYHFYFIRVVSCLIFFVCFMKVVFATDIFMRWNKIARY